MFHFPRSGRLIFCLSAIATLTAIGPIVQAEITIDTVAVGNAGNTGEVQSQGTFGSVSYEYNIGKYEVTAGQYAAFLNAVAATDTYGLYNTNMANTQTGSGISRGGASGSYTYSIDSAFVNRPVNYVSWGDAARFANWLHNGQPTGAQNAGTTEDGAYALNGATSNAALLAVSRESDWKWAITSEDEWYKAAYYNPATTSYYDYPTSSDTAPGRDLADASGNNANFNGSPYPIDSPYYTTEVGEFQNSDSPYGTFDQGGNVWEWNEALISGSSRGLRGGAFYSADSGLLASARIDDHPTIESNGVGFRLSRVSEIPEPGIVALLAVGGVALLRRRSTVAG